MVEKGNGAAFITYQMEILVSMRIIILYNDSMLWFSPSNICKWVGGATLKFFEPKASWAANMQDKHIGQW